MRQVSRTPDVSAPDPWPLRITSIFEWPHSDSTGGVVIVPCVVIGEQTDPVVVDLRSLPADLRLGTHQLRIIHTEVSPKNPPRTRIVFQLLEPAGPRHFLGPGNLLAQGMPADLSFRGEPDEQQLMWMDTIIPDAPIVTLTNALVRVDGPWTLRLPLE